MRARSGDPLPDDSGDGSGAFAPLAHLSRVPHAASGVVVLSVGGNDLREILRSMERLQVGAGCTTLASVLPRHM